MNLLDSDGRSLFFNRNMVNRHFHYHPSSAGATLSLTANATAGASIIALSSSGFSTGQFVEVEEDSRGETQIRKIVSQSSRNYTLDSPLDGSYSTSATAELTNLDLASSSGSIAAPVSNYIKPPANEIWIIDRILISGLDGTQPTDGNFMGIAALSAGCVVRLSASTGTRTISTWRTGGDMVEDMYDVDYAQRGAGGDWGTRGRWTFTKAGINIVLRGHLKNPDSTTTEELQVLVQDNLGALSSLEMKGQGRIFTEYSG